VPTQAWPGSDEADKWETANRWRVERESERPIVLEILWQQKHGGGKGPYVVYVRESGTRW
jgi:hypothetical protein